MARVIPLSLARVTHITVAVLLLAGTLASAQDVPEPTLKAAFIYNFALFTEWPARASAVTEPLAFCVVGDPAVGDALKQVVKGRLLAGRNIGVLQMASSGSPRGCHVVYLSGVTVAQAMQLVAGLRDEPVLTMSDLEGFTDQGGMAQCFFEHGHLRFNVRLEPVTRARLQISSRLLALARIR
jgi:hypothetical protein